MLKSADGNPLGIGKRIFSSLFFGVFLAAGLLFSGFFARSFLANAATYRWIPVECVVTDSQIVPATGTTHAPALFVRYRYRYEGQTYDATRLSQGISSSRDTAEVYRLNQQLAVGTRSTCYVDPARPADAVLFRGSLWVGLFILFPLVFVAVGGGALYFTWRPTVAGSRPISTGARDARRSRAGLSLFFGVFFLFGAGFGYFFALKPVLQIFAAQRWPSVPCTIVSSRVATHSGDKGSTFSVEIVYRYVVDGRSYTSARYQFMTGSSSGYAGKAAVVGRLPAGSKALCYFNPGDPAEAVIERGFTSDLWFGLIPLLFTAVGAGGLWFARSGRSQPGQIGADPASTSQPWVSQPESSLAAELRPRQSRGTKLVVLVIIALFWNGIVGAIVGHQITEWRGGGHDWFTAMFLTPFGVIGLVLLGAAAYQALSFSNPRPRLTVNPRAVPLGRAFEVTWVLEGKVSALRRLHIFLEGREEATYRRGTNTSTDRRIFATLDLVNTTEPGLIGTGSAKLTVPADSMHSWQAANNRIIWALRVQGEIPRWPDINEEFPFTVLPHPTA